MEVVKDGLGEGLDSVEEVKTLPKKKKSTFKKSSGPPPRAVGTTAI